MAQLLRVVCLAFALVGLSSLAACGVDEPDDPRLREKLVLLDAAALERVAVPLARLRGSPAAMAATGWLAKDPACTEWLWKPPARQDDAKDTNRTPRCAEDVATIAPDLVELARARRGDADGVVFWPLGPNGYATIRVRIDPDGTVDLEGTLHLPDEDPTLRLLLPAGGLPAPALVPAAHTVAHLRLRPRDGLGIAAWLPEGGQADRLFALKGRLLEGALLRGTLEVAFLPAPDGSARPAPLLALHHRAAGPIREALDEALDQLETTWPIQRTPRRFDTASDGTLEGGCFRELPLLPGFAPCWVVTEDALFVAYHSEAIEAALGAPPVSASGKPTGDADAATHLRVDLAGMARRDRRLDGATDVVRPGDVWHEFTASLRPGDRDDVTISARLSRSRR